MIRLELPGVEVSHSHHARPHGRLTSAGGNVSFGRTFAAEAQASIDLHEMKVGRNGRPKAGHELVRPSSIARPRPLRRLQSTSGGRRRGRPTRRRDHLVGEKPHPAVRLLGEHEHPEVVAFGLAAAGYHVAKPTQDVVLAVEVDLAAC